MKNWCFWTVVLEKTLESLLDCKEIQPVHPKGNQSWVFIGRTDVEAEAPILWPPDAKSWLIWKHPDAGKDWGQEEKGTTEDEMVGWHHQLDGHGFGWTPGVGDGQGDLVCCSSWGHRVGHNWVTELNWTELQCNYPAENYLCVKWKFVVVAQSVMSDSLWPHGLQHARLPYPSLPPGVCSSSSPLTGCCHPTIPSSVGLFSCPQSFPASGSFLMSQPLTSCGHSIGASA